MAQSYAICDCTVKDLICEFKKNLLRLKLTREQFDELCTESQDDNQQPNVKMNSEIKAFPGEIDQPRLKFAVMGTVSAGKSTVTDGLIGQNLAPKRDNACTFLPVCYRHDSTAKEQPRLILKDDFVDIFNGQLGLIRDSLVEEKVDDGKAVKQECLKILISKIAKAEAPMLLTTYDGGDVQITLMYIQDFVRLVFEDVRLRRFRDVCLQYFRLEMLPVVLAGLSQLENAGGRIKC
eukprot:TRINITY_DN789_c0_g1_i2.p1 TRINITY_DN789_c0_g1~~TRINITY_DN789_c0_g1_i2.p1  ORF type:complete len:235 (+),score=33.21 TRINITY_DN789_c0_g1_i2:161-865(+)